MGLFHLTVRFILKGGNHEENILKSKMIIRGGAIQCLNQGYTILCIKRCRVTDYLLIRSLLHSVGIVINSKSLALCYEVEQIFETVHS